MEENTIYSIVKKTFKKVEKSLKKVLTRGFICDKMCKHWTREQCFRASEKNLKKSEKT